MLRVCSHGHNDHHQPPPTQNRWVQLAAGLDVLPPLPTADAAAMEAGMATYRSQQRMVHVLEHLRSRALAAAALTCV